ncbi:MAG: LamG domain-containing protein, partial [Kofleriaceae bacterium]
AAADYDPDGTRWHYLEDQRNRTWTPMTPDGGGVIGTDPANAITTCRAQPSAPACAALPGALLISTAGSTSAADPAIAFTSPTPQVIQLSVRVHVASDAGAEQRVRIYRNSREDELFTGTAVEGTTFEHSLTVDALPDDRFFLALAPAAGGAAQVAAHFYINGTGAAFPSTCQLAVGFGAATGNTVDNACGPDVTHNDYMAGMPVPPVLGPGPYPELGQAADLTAEKYYETANVLDKAGDTTVQLWVKHDAVVDVYGAWLFSDLDLDATGGLGIVIYDQSGLRMEVTTCTAAGPLMFAGEDVAYPADAAWHFIRVVHTAGNVAICLDGTRVASFPTATGKLTSTFHPYIGKNVRWTPAGAFTDASIDDVRVLSTALPCN